MVRWTTGMAAGVAVGMFCAGCGQPGGDYKTAKQINQTQQGTGHAGHDHGHEAGPHGGSIVELGDEEYHAEVVVDGKSHAMTVYVLGKDAKTATPVAAAEVTVVVGEKQLVLKAVPQDGESAGKSSKFELVDADSVDAIAKDGFLHANLRAEIDGKQYHGEIDYHFDGSSHDDHGEEKKDEVKTEEPAEPARPSKSNEPADEPDIDNSVKKLKD